MKDFSIVIPAYNNLPLLKRALHSVLMQKDVSYDIVVVDDSSTSQIEAFMRGLCHEHIAYYHNRPSRGAVANWNYGLSLATGRNLILLHHDEAFEEDSHLSELSRKMAGYDMAVSEIKVYVDGKEKRRFFPIWFKKMTFRCPWMYFLANPIGPTACVCFRREQLVPFDERLKWLVDVEWYYRLLKACRTTVCDRTVSSVFGHAGQITTSLDVRETERADMAFLKEKYRSNGGIRIVLRMREIVYKAMRKAKRTMQSNG